MCCVNGWVRDWLFTGLQQNRLHDPHEEVHSDYRPSVSKRSRDWDQARNEVFRSDYWPTDDLRLVVATYLPTRPPRGLYLSAGSPCSTKWRLPMSLVQYVLLYRAKICAYALNKKYYRHRLASVQNGGAMQVPPQDWESNESVLVPPLEQNIRSLTALGNMTK